MKEEQDISNKRISMQQFEILFKKKIFKHAKKLEEYRIEIFKKTKYFTVLSIIIPVSIFSAIPIFVVFVNCCKINIDSPVYFFALLITIVILIVCWIFILFTHENLLKKYRYKAKKLVISELISLIIPFKLEENDIGYNYISRLSLFDSFNYCEIDDTLHGKYNNLDIDITEIKLIEEKRTSDNNTIRKKVFGGLLITLPSLKKINGRTVVKANSMIKKITGRIVNMEDPEFEKYYDVYSTDQIEARYMLTTAFMERMVVLAAENKEKKQSIALSFEMGKVNIAFSANKNFFELPISKSAIDFETYKNILDEFIIIFDIIDSLKLDQNIGM